LTRELYQGGAYTVYPSRRLPSLRGGSLFLPNKTGPQRTVFEEKQEQEEEEEEKEEELKWQEGGWQKQ
jgi:hypothetical protein